MRRTLMVLLALSIAGNVFLGGFVAGRMLGGPPHHKGAVIHGMGASRAPLIAAAEQLSPEGRAIFKETFKAEGVKLREAFGQSGELRRAFAETLGAEPFDRPKAEAALAALLASDTENHRAASVLVIDAAEKMTPADRKTLVESYRKPHERRHRR